MGGWVGEYDNLKVFFPLSILLQGVSCGFMLERVLSN